MAYGISEGFSPVTVYVTCADDAEARRIADVLVAERLVACVNILGACTSVFRWEGQVAAEGEVVFVAKSGLHLASALTETVVAHHSYDVPCVTFLPIVAGNPAYIDWLHSEIKE